jgi:predicted RNase H-like HicB family nuclease
MILSFKPINPEHKFISQEMPSIIWMLPIKIIVEKHSDGYVAYPIGIKGTVVSEGDTYEEALADVKSAIRFHLKTFGQESLETDGIREAFLAEVIV